jgi:toxin ParE1/3/4
VRRFRIHEDASTEAESAAAWYERQCPGLGAEFNESIQAALDLLEEGIVPLSPLPGSSGIRGAKRLILQKFPFDVVVADDGTAFVVLAFAHHARRPGYWRDRERA